MTLAINGGQPLRERPFPARTPFGDREIELLTQAVRSQNLFGLGGPMVSAFEEGFAKLYDAKYSVGSTSGTALATRSFARPSRTAAALFRCSTRTPSRFSPT